jgi:hypothetical protein
MDVRLSGGDGQVQVRKRLWGEVVLGVASAVMLLATLVWPEWIEAVFGVDPDGGNGELEWGIVALLALSTVVFSFMVRVEWRRASAVGRDQEIGW